MIDLSRFRAAIFDFDGVIADSETLQLQAWHQVARELNISGFHCPLEKIAGRQDIHIAPELFSPPYDSDHAMRRKWAIEHDLAQAGQMLPMPGSLELIRHLSQTFQLAIASSRRPGSIEHWLNRHELFAKFHAIVGQVEGLPCKPSPAPYLRALQLLNVCSGQACAIEDSPVGIEASKAANIYTIQLCHSHMPRCAAADCQIESLRQLMPLAR